MSLIRRLVVSPERNLDLVLLWVVSLVAQPLVPFGSSLGRADLVPWTTAMLVAVAMVRGRSLGDEPFPSLTPRRVRWAELSERLSLLLVPVALALIYDAAGQRASGQSRLPELAVLPGFLHDPLWMAVMAFVLVGVAALLGRRDKQTSWRPGVSTTGRQWTVRTVFLLVAAACSGALSAWLPGVLAVMPPSMLLGLQFLAVGLLPDRNRTRWQRRTAGRRDGRAYRPPRFRFALALLGPSAGYALLLFLHHLLIAPVTFDQAPVVALHVFAWSSVIWPKRIPVAMSCILHEVVPGSGKDPSAGGNRVAFDRPPEGALRLEPLGIRRIRAIHHWIVPVQDPRIEELDDPVRPLWPRAPVPLAAHVLGDATFEPDPTNQMPQWRTITVRLSDQRDVVRLEQGNVQTRRLVVLRAFPGRSQSGTLLPTYRWDEAISAGAVQIVDATTERIALQDGDVMVLSTEGVARAYELEIGAAIDDWDEIGRERTPQLEDYVGVG